MLVLKGLHACTLNMAFKLWVIYCTFIAVCVCSLGEEADNLSEGEQVKDAVDNSVEEKNVPAEVSDTIAEALNVNATVNETDILDVNGTIISNSSQTENSTRDKLEVSNTTSKSSGLPKWLCRGRNNSQSNDSLAQKVIIVNSEELLKWINTTADNESDSCAVVLFFTHYCPFCAKLAPMYNALGRVYNNLPILAIDAYKQHSMDAISESALKEVLIRALELRFTEIQNLSQAQTKTLFMKFAAIPHQGVFTVLPTGHGKAVIFQLLPDLCKQLALGKPVLKFNNSITLDDLRMFVKNNTGVEGNFSVQISEQDHIGPLMNKPVEDTDYYLLFSVLFLLVFGAFMFAKSSYRQLVWDRIQAIPWQRFLQWFRRDKQD